MFPLLSSLSEDTGHISRDTFGEWGVFNKCIRMISTNLDGAGQTRYEHLNQGGSGWLVASPARYGDDTGELGLRKTLGKIGRGAGRGPGTWEQLGEGRGVLGCLI